MTNFLERRAGGVAAQRCGTGKTGGCKLIIITGKTGGVCEPCALAIKVLLCNIILSADQIRAALTDSIDELPSLLSGANSTQILQIHWMMMMNVRNEVRCFGPQKFVDKHWLKMASDVQSDRTSTVSDPILPLSQHYFGRQRFFVTQRQHPQNTDRIYVGPLVLVRGRAEGSMAQTASTLGEVSEHGRGRG